VLYQFRIIATVFISVFLFTDRHYSRTKWICCFFLFAGIVIANLDSFFAAAAISSTTTSSDAHTEYPTFPFPSSNNGGGEKNLPVIGEGGVAGEIDHRQAHHARAVAPSASHLEYTLASLAVLFSGIATAFAGVYTEKLLKETSTLSNSNNISGNNNANSGAVLSANSPWVRNVHFGTLGVIYTCTLALKDWGDFAEKGVFFGFEPQV
jgi:drug/metabolite transporter (DMT)-like permease